MIIQEYGKETVLRLGDEAPMFKSDSERTAAFKWAALSQNKAKIDNLIALSCSSIPLSPGEMDTSPYLFNCKNGTLDVKTMEFRKHRQQDFITKLAGVEYLPYAECPLWLNHLKLVFNDDDAGTFIRGFQEICGYSLIAGNPEQLMFILYGTGKNGKSVTLETLAKIWGDYAVNIAPETLMQRRNNEGPRGDIARIAGARLITSSEGEDGARLAEAIIKQLTGGDRVTVRRLYEREFEFVPEGKIWLSTNHKPIIMGTDYAIWRRIWLIPFMTCIPDDKRDQNIKGKLAREGSGILNWCLAGLTRYFEHGTLPQPVRITEASQVYRDDSDLLGDFLNDRCVMQGEITRSGLLAEYRNWCSLANEKPISNKRFTSLLENRGLTTRKSGNDRYWIGISLGGQVKFS
jgi:putative DNA primase/helicase